MLSLSGFELYSRWVPLTKLRFYRLINPETHFFCLFLKYNHSLQFLTFYFNFQDLILSPTSYRRVLRM